MGQVLVYPLEIAKTRLALCKPGHYRGALHCIGQIVKMEGPFALYAGLLPSLCGIVPYAGIELSANSLMKETLSAYLEARGQEAGVWVLLASGVCSSSLAMTLTYPLNLIRTKIQANGLLPPEKRITSTANLVTSLVAKDGLRGLYRGMVPNMLKVLPATAISYTSYSYLSDTFKLLAR